MRYVFFFAFSFMFLFSHAQFGLNIKYNLDDYSAWSEDIATGLDNTHGNSVELGLNYWFRLKNKRIEFYPEVAYTLGTNSNYELNDGRIDAKINVWSLNLNTVIYPFDFNGDCDCPVWSKQGDVLQKGFFINISPFIDYDMYSGTVSTSVFESPLDTKFVSFGLGLGAGIDIGISDLLTLSPFFQFNYTPTYNNDGFTSIYALSCPTCSFIPVEDGNKTQLQFGIRLSFRPDYK